ncbi:ATP-binding cassette domain-containing protein [Saprospiraceae bacterium]|nr:ATP-binding cassette domain-containing protein [Saprospiraceae bacterium]
MSEYKSEQVSIKVEALTKIYGKQKAIESISFEAKEGQITGLVGPNGAGKSTTMKILTGSLTSDGGDAYVCGIDVSAEELKVKSLIGYLPESNPLYPSMYVKEFLGFICKIHKIPNAKDRINDVITAVGLDKEKHKKISSLSKGYRQRVGIAQALIHDPKVLILDEPISGLDPNQIQEIRQLIVSLKKDKTIIFSSHILQEVESICDKIIILNNGEIVADNNLSHLQESHSQSIVIELELLKSMPENVLKNIDPSLTFVKSEGNHFVLEIGSGKDVREAIFDRVVENNNKILSMAMQKKNLENLFKSVTK